jgi:hypothetical protein
VRAFLSARSFAAGLMAVFLAMAGAARATIASADDARSPDAAALRASFERMRGQLDSAHFGRPLRLVSQEGDHVLQGDVYGLVGHPFARVEQGLHDGAHWCEVLVLPFNTKKCEARGTGDPSSLSLYIARRKDSAPDDSYRVDFRYHVEALQRDFLRVDLRAQSGPLGTHDYRILLEATPADDGHTILHLSYSYGYGALSQIAMQAYLATAGASKVGFTTVEEGGRTRLVGGMRGVMERNTMRYFLAIEAYLESLSSPQAGREERRFAAWFDATERYARQLHEMSREQYLSMKRREMRYAGSSMAEGS